MGSDLHWMNRSSCADDGARAVRREFELKIKKIEQLLYRIKDEIHDDPDHPFADIMQAAEVETLEAVLEILRDKNLLPDDLSVLGVARHGKEPPTLKDQWK